MVNKFKKYAIRVFLLITILSIVISIAFVQVINDISSNVEIHDSKFKDKVGRKIIIEKDTLLIVDYSIIKDVFILSNGIEVSSELVFNQK